MAGRGGLALAGLSCLALLVLLGLAVGPRATGPDQDAKWVLREPLDERPYRRGITLLATETAWPHASYLMAALPIVGAAGLLAYEIAWRRRPLELDRWRWLPLALAALPLQHLLRVAFGRAGPRVPLWAEVGRGAYPSGAALLVALGWGVGLVMALGLRPRWRVVLVAVAVVALGLHGAARVAAQKHWATDIIGSYLLAAGMLLLAATCAPARRRG